MSGDDGEALALASIAEVITEARALVKDSGGLDYNQALIDLTMSRIRPDVQFLILGADEDEVIIGGEPYVEAPRPSNGQAKPVKAKRERAITYVTVSPADKRGGVRHVRLDCPRVRAGYDTATNRETRTLPLCLQCRD